MITENYIKMCEKAEEIQKAWKPELADWFYSKEIDDSVLILGFTKESRKEIRKGIWLPTQEQLQEMMIPTLGDDFLGCAPLVLNRKLEESLFSNGIYNWGTSYQELWLAFVIKEKYNKVWDGEKWK
jgi:hypothetical protein